MKVLSGHESKETAYVVEDYPYGFRLRCKIRYWLEYKPGKGVRFVSQTSNPRKEGLVWNKEKASTYCRFGGAMYINDNDHVNWNGANEYMETSELIAFRDKYYEWIPVLIRPELDRFIKGKLIYDERVKNGMHWQQAGRETALEMAAESLGIVLTN